MTSFDKEHLKKELYARVNEMGLDWRSKSSGVYIADVFGEGKNAIYRLLLFKTKETFLKYMEQCKFVTKGTVRARKNSFDFFDNCAAKFDQVKKDGRKVRIVVFSPVGFLGHVTAHLTKSRETEVSVKFKSNEQWEKLIQDFDLSAEDSVCQTPNVGHKHAWPKGTATPKIRRARMDPTPEGIHCRPRHKDGRLGFKTPSKKSPCNISGPQCQTPKAPKAVQKPALTKGTATPKISRARMCRMGPIAEGIQSPCMLPYHCEAGHKNNRGCLGFETPFIKTPCNLSGPRGKENMPSTNILEMSVERITCTPPKKEKDLIRALNETTEKMSAMRISEPKQVQPEIAPIQLLDSYVDTYCDAVPLLVAQIQEIPSIIYETMKRKRNWPPAMTLSAIKHPKRGNRYFLVTKGFEAKLKFARASKSAPNGVDMVYAIPKGFEAQRNSTQTIRNRVTEVGARIVESLTSRKAKKNKTRFDWNEKACRLLGALVANHPKIAALAWEQIVPFILRAFLLNYDFDVPIERLACVCPCRTTIENNLRRFATDSVLVCIKSIEDCGNYSLSFDKADKSKGKMGGCIKVVATFDLKLIWIEFPDGEVRTMQLDADKTGDSSKDVAAGVAFSMKKLNLSENVLGMGVTTDSGGGGTLNSVLERGSSQSDVTTFSISDYIKLVYY